MIHDLSKYRLIICNIRALHICLAFFLGGCQTILGPSEEEKKEADIIRTQKSLMISFLNKGMPDIALKELKTLRRKYPKDPDFQNITGLALLSIKTPKQAIGYFKKAYALDNRTPFILNLSSAFIEANQHKRALSTLFKITKSEEFLSYEHPERVYHNIGLSSEKLKKYKIATKYYKKALTRNPTFYISLMRLGQVYQKTQKYKASRKYFTKAQNLCNTCYGPVSAIASTYISENKSGKAIKVLRRYIKVKKVKKSDKLRATKLMRMAGKIDNSSTKTSRF